MLTPIDTTALSDGMKAGKPGKPAKQVQAGLRKQTKVMNLGGQRATNKGKR